MLKALRIFGLSAAVVLSGCMDFDMGAVMGVVDCAVSGGCGGASSGSVPQHNTVSAHGTVTENGLPLSSVVARLAGATDTTDVHGYYFVVRAGVRDDQCSSLSVLFQHPDGRTATVGLGGCRTPVIDYDFTEATGETP